MITKTGAFRDEECTCWCGNKHELYGGSGYETVSITGYSNGKTDGGSYVHVVNCKRCGAKSEYSEK